MGLRYLGNKSRMIDQILRSIRPLGPARLVDIFSGTGTVAQAVAKAGIPVLANDHLYSAVVMTQASCLTRDQVSFSELVNGTVGERYSEVLARLNDLPGRQGFFWREYAPSGRSQSGHKRFYLTTDNAQRIDAIRHQIASWAGAGAITRCEEHLLLADLARAMNQVANIAGTYGCFLQPWAANALRPLSLVPRSLVQKAADVEVTCLDFSEVETGPRDVIYADPPYTKRQYAAYYHLLETLCYGDEPAVHGVTGLRPWRENSSLFCYKTKARGAFENLLANARASAVVISYSSDGHVPHRELLELGGEFGSVDHAAVSINRYSSNLKRGSRERVIESIYTIRMDGATEKALSA